MTEKIRQFFCGLQGHSYSDRYLQTTHLGDERFEFRNHCVRCGKEYVNVVRISFPWLREDAVDD